MAEVIDIHAWRRRRDERVGAASLPGEDQEGPAQEDLALLERAVQRLNPLVAEILGGGRQLQGKVETELLAIMGELTMGLVREATLRAERLANRLVAGGASRG
jgi:hypothetical protein